MILLFLVGMYMFTVFEVINNKQNVKKQQLTAGDRFLRISAFILLFAWGYVDQKLTDNPYDPMRYWGFGLGILVVAYFLSKQLAKKL